MLVATPVCKNMLYSFHYARYFTIYLCSFSNCHANAMPWWLREPHKTFVIRLQGGGCRDKMCAVGAQDNRAKLNRFVVTLGT